MVDQGLVVTASITGSTMHDKRISRYGVYAYL